MGRLWWGGFAVSLAAALTMAVVSGFRQEWMPAFWAASTATWTLIAARLAWLGQRAAYWRDRCIAADAKTAVLTAIIAILGTREKTSRSHGIGRN